MLLPSDVNKTNPLYRFYEEVINGGKAIKLILPIEIRIAVKFDLISM